MEKSGFFADIEGDRGYTDNFLAEWVASFIGNGVYNTELGVMAAGDMNITVQPGRAWINGRIYILTEALTIPVEVSDGKLNRYTSIVLRADANARKITVQTVDGTYSAQPAAPNVTRNSEIYELKLADIYVAAGAISISQAEITDTRLDNEVCGLVYCPVDHIDTETLYTQIQADLERFQSESQAGFDEWFEEINNKLGTEPATALQQQIDEIIQGQQKVKSAEGADKLVGTTSETLFSKLGITRGEFIDLTVPPGTVWNWAGKELPDPAEWGHWAFMNGEALSRTEHADLFANVGTTYGSGNGSTTFNLPDGRGRVLVGSDANLGVKSGAKNHALTNAELPVLSGSIVMHSSNVGTNIQTVSGVFKPAITNNGKYRGGGELVSDAGTSSVGHFSLNIGGGQAMSLVQPSLYLNYLIKV